MKKEEIIRRHGLLTYEKQLQQSREYYKVNREKRLQQKKRMGGNAQRGD